MNKRSDRPSRTMSPEVREALAATCPELDAQDFRVLDDLIAKDFQDDTILPDGDPIAEAVRLLLTLPATGSAGEVIPGSQQWLEQRTKALAEWSNLFDRTTTPEGLFHLLVPFSVFCRECAEVAERSGWFTERRIRELRDATAELDTFWEFRPAVHPEAIAELLRITRELLRQHAIIVRAGGKPVEATEVGDPSISVNALQAAPMNQRKRPTTEALIHEWINRNPDKLLSVSKRQLAWAIGRSEGTVGETRAWRTIMEQRDDERFACEETCPDETDDAYLRRALKRARFEEG